MESNFYYYLFGVGRDSNDALFIGCLFPFSEEDLRQVYAEGIIDKCTSDDEEISAEEKVKLKEKTTMFKAKYETLSSSVRSMDWLLGGYKIKEKISKKELQRMLNLRVNEIGWEEFTKELAVSTKDIEI